MDQEHRPVIIAGNWKMYKTIKEGLVFVKELLPMIKDSNSEVYLAVPYTLIKPLADTVKRKIVIGAQNMNDATEGAFTGEVAAMMLKDVGARFVILGHSERRRLFGETNEFINRKVKRALSAGVQPILCIGETEQERDEGKTQEVLRTQLTECLASVRKTQFKRMILAYEPVWAIGTDRVATPQEAQEAHRFCRQVIRELAGDEAGDGMSILYGGSVKPENVHELVNEPDLDGVLVGGASLNVETFSKIVNFNQV